MKRCEWAESDLLYMAYHDEEWGRPQYDSLKLFEMLCLEGMQAGLSWITILKKRENYQKAFDGFKPEIIAGYSPEKVEQLMQNKGIIRNRRKIEAIITNARACLSIQETASFSDYLWAFVGGRPIVHRFASHDDIPSSDEMSRRMSRDLKKHGFKFVGETICYAFMQATGMVNDHLIDCFCYRQISGESQPHQ